MATEGPLEALVLAAGAGRRYGGAKLTAPFGGGVLLDGALAAAFAAPVRTVTVITGADPAAGPAARAFASAQGESARLRLVHAESHAEGMGASLAAGLASLPADAAGVFVFLGDMPRIPAGIAPALAEAVSNGALAAAPVFEGQRGHPVLLSRGLFAATAAVGGDRGASVVLAGLGNGLALIPTDDPGVRFDVDRPDR